MNNALKSLLFLTSTVGIFFLSGCSGSRQISQTVQPDRLNTQKYHGSNDVQRDRALQHFIEGAALDAKGSYAEAILEYQEAIQADPNAAIYFAISKDYLLLGKLNRAAETAVEAVQLEPKNIHYRENLGTIYFNASRVDLAIREYEEVVRIDSQNTPGWFTLARLYQLNQPLKAIEIYEKLLDQNGDQFDVLFQCAQIYASLGRYDEAAEKYKRMIELDPNNKPLQKQLADTFAKGGKLDQSRSILETIVETDSSDAEAIAALADVYLEQREFHKAINLYEKLINQGITNPEIKLRIAVGYFGLIGQDSTLTQKAEHLFNNLQNEIPQDWRPYWYLGAIAANQHKDSLAADYFEQVIKRESNHAEAWWFFGSSLFSQEKYNELLSAMEHAQKVLPDDFRFYLLQGLALTRMGRQEDAIPSLEKAYELNPKDINTLSTLALTLDALRHFQESDRLYEEGLKQDTSSALLLNNYSYSLAERGLQLHRALEMSKQAVTAEPENASYLDTYGWIFFKLERYEDAVIYLEKAIATGNASSVIYEHLGDVFQKLGQKEKALEMWMKALEIDPKNEAAKEKTTHGAN